MVSRNGESLPQEQSNGADDRRRSGASRRTTSEQLASRMHAGVELLLRAFECAADVECDAWDFAVDLSDLKAAGLSSSDLRWLLRKEFVDHGRELTLPGDTDRSFRRTPGLRFSRYSCFVLTKRGATFLRQLRTSAPPPRIMRIDASHPDAPPPRCRVPQWNGDLLELRVDGQLIKQFKVPAPNQEMILAAFEEEGWPARIDDPLPPHPQQDPKRRLHDTINSLNRNHKAARVRFLGDGSGQGVRWTSVDDGVETPAED